jgi:hypothetical protein
VGDAVSDDPLCRDLCVRSDAIVISADYRHAPEHRFPAAVDDAMAAVRWVADNAEALGGMPGRLAVCGWARVAISRRWFPSLPGTRVDHTHRQAGIADAANRRRPDTLPTSRTDSYGLTTALAQWCYDHYIDPPIDAVPFRALVREAICRVAACDRGDGRVRSTDEGKASPLHSMRRASSSTSVPAATHTSR